MTTGVLAPVPILQFFGNDGNPAVGGSVLTTVGGANAATYQDVALTTPLPNPIPLNSRGEVSTGFGASAQCFLTPNVVYAFTLFDANGNQLWVASYMDGVQIEPPPWFVATAAEIAAGVTPVAPWYPPGNILRYGGVDDDFTDNKVMIDNAILVGGTIEFPVTSVGIYQSSGGHTLADGVSLKGTGMRAGQPYGGSGLKLTADATMFVCIARNTFEDLEFSTTTTATPFVNAGTAIQVGTLSAYAGLVKIIRCRIFNYHVGISNRGGLFLTVQDCSLTNNNYGAYFYNTGATTTNATMWIDNQIYANQRGGIGGSMAGRGVGHSFIGGSIEGNCSENVVTYPYQVGGLICSQISFRNVYMEYSNGAVAAPDFINVSNMSDGSIEDCYLNLGVSTSGTGIIATAATSSRMFIRNTRFLGSNFTADVNMPACTSIRLQDNDHSGPTSTIIGATSASPPVFQTSAAHGWSNGFVVQLDNLPGDFASNLNGNTYSITVTDSTHFSIAVNATAYTAYTSGGTARQIKVTLSGTNVQNILTRVAPSLKREAAFTPIILGTSTAGTQTYSAGTIGLYTQIDNLVHIRLRVTLTAKDGTTAGNIQVGGLPLPSSSTTGGYTTFAVGAENFSQSAARTQFVGRLTAGATAIDILESGDNVTLSAAPAASLQTTTSFYITGVYAVASPT